MAPGKKEGMVDFLPFFIYFARLVAMKDGSNMSEIFKISGDEVDDKN